ncbi:hypothetical protein Leryth_026454 [Lithospermum erythrorhizon]|nr:hypothetical protein Leryth_026454 [Lithospermum erythrorhizon]
MAASLLSTPTLSSSSFFSQQILDKSVTRQPDHIKAKLKFYGGNISKFPRINVWDPYKRLGITPDASEDEVWSSRNFLLNQYSGHERSAEAIESAFEKILMGSFVNRKKTKINLKTRLKKKVEESPPWVKQLLSFVEIPPNVIIMRRFFLFAFMACWSVMNSADAGPAFQVALSLAACIYFLNDKTKSVARASIIGNLITIIPPSPPPPPSYHSLLLSHCPLPLPSCPPLPPFLPAAPSLLS